MSGSPFVLVAMFVLVAVQAIPEVCDLSYVFIVQQNGFEALMWWLKAKLSFFINKKSLTFFFLFDLK